MKKWTEQDVAATKIQKLVRGFLARLQLRRLRKAKDDYEEEMKRLEKEALLAVVRRQQEEAEKLRQKEEEERRRVIEHNKRKKRMLEVKTSMLPSPCDNDRNLLLSGSLRWGHGRDPRHPKGSGRFGHQVGARERYHREKPSRKASAGHG